MIHMRNVRREELTKQLIRKMAPPLVTLLSSPPEVQWVALRNINLLLQKRPDILQNEMRVFFCKYNDPLYVKVEKLDIMIRLAGESNVDALLSELKEYASEVDVDFVRRSIKAIGQCAIKIDTSADRCVNVLLDLIGTKVTYVVQEAVVVMKVRVSLGRLRFFFRSYCCRIFSVNTHRHTKVLSPHYAQILKS